MSGVNMIIGLLVYVVILMFFGWYIPRKQSGGADFLLGGRNVPFVLVLGTCLATLVGTGSTMGAVGSAYNNGWGGGACRNRQRFRIFYINFCICKRKRI